MLWLNAACLLLTVSLFWNSGRGSKVILRSRMLPPKRVLTLRHHKRYNIKQGASFSIWCTANNNFSGLPVDANFHFVDTAVSFRTGGENEGTQQTGTTFNSNCECSPHTSSLPVVESNRALNVTVAKTRLSSGSYGSVNVTLSFHSFQPVNNNAYLCLAKVTKCSPGHKSKRRLYETGQYSVEPVTPEFQVYHKSAPLHVEVSIHGEFHSNVWTHTSGSPSPALPPAAALDRDLLGKNDRDTYECNFRQGLTIRRPSPLHLPGRYTAYVQQERSSGFDSKYTILYREAELPRVNLTRRKGDFGTVRSFVWVCTATGYPRPQLFLAVVNRTASQTSRVYRSAQVVLQNASLDSSFSVQQELTLMNMTEADKRTVISCRAVEKVSGEVAEEKLTVTGNCLREISSTCSGISTVEWPETEMGQNATLPCPYGSTEATALLWAHSRAVRFCSNSTEGTWGDEQCQPCQVSSTTVELSKLFQEPSIPRVTSILLSTTANREAMRSTDVALAAALFQRILDNLSSFVHETTVVDDFFRTIDQVMEVSQVQLQLSNEMYGSVNRVIDTLEKAIDLIANFSQFNGTSSKVYLYTNFAFQILCVPELNASFSPNITGLVLASRKGLPGTTNTEHNELISSTASLPWEVVSPGEKLAVGAFLDSTSFPEGQAGVRVGSIAVYVSLPQMKKQEFFTAPVAFVFDKNKEVQAQSEPNLSCVFWSHDINGFQGGWSSEGCHLVNQTESTVTCHCYHLTSFSIIMSPKPNREATTEDIVFTGFSYVGAALSTIGLLLTIATFSASRKLRKNLHRQLLMNLCLALLGLYVTFIITNTLSFSFSHLISSAPALCAILAALLHYFFLVTFISMATTAYNLYRQLVIVFNSEIKSYLSISILLSWVVPVFIVGFSVAPNYEYYTGKVMANETIAYCRAQSWPFYFGMLLPFGVIYLFNSVLFLIIFVNIVYRPSLNVQESKATRMKENFYIMLALSLLFGVSWGFGLLTTAEIPNEIRKPFDFIFTVLAGLQGVFIFLLYCVKSEDCRKIWKQWVTCSCRRKTTANNRLNNPLTMKAGKMPSKATAITIQLQEQSNMAASLSRETKFTESTEDQIKVAHYSPTASVKSCSVEQGIQTCAPQPNNTAVVEKVGPLPGSEIQNITTAN